MRLTIANAFGDNFPHEVFVEIDPADASREHIDLHVDEKPIRKHQLEGLVVRPFAKHDSPRLQLFFELLQ
jgi:hypothetical protein